MLENQRPALPNLDKILVAPLTADECRGSMMCTATAGRLIVAESAAASPRSNIQDAAAATRQLWMC